jgi:hypothetical protein
MKRIKITSKLSPRIRHTGPAEPLVDPESIAAALDAKLVDTIPLGLAPPALHALRAEISSRLTSTGGRPALAGTVRRQKIPLNDEDWARLLRLARRFDQDRIHPTPGQVASALLCISLANLDLAESLLRAREPIPDLLWTQREAPTGGRLRAFVAQFRGVTVTEGTDPVSEETTKRLYRCRAESLKNELE